MRSGIRVLAVLAVLSVLACARAYRVPSPVFAGFAT
jgi:hypothetical protein